MTTQETNGWVRWGVRIGLAAVLGGLSAGSAEVGVLPVGEAEAGLITGVLALAVLFIRAKWATK